ncbi:18185_t:CDS:2 [Cetraspora pellucida]|uniref:18185_t:CDS:1 n=1 Tax=Cetraspora pellucida TaxID=1433469 RepID=A0ACA9LRY4_9GLOM|nr:18185_t:CDS:2 [Cetraspora pellucida]
MEEKDSLILMELVKKYGTKKLVEHLQDHDDSMELSSAFKEIRKWNVPYVKYFEIISYPNWSLYHYDAWVDNNYNKRLAHTTFYKVLSVISNDKESSNELHEKVRRLLKEKKSSKTKLSVDKENKKYTNTQDIVNNKKRKKNPILQASSIDLNSSHIDSKSQSIESINDINIFKRMLLNFFKSRSSYSLLSANEAVLQVVTELLLPNNRIPELCLLMNNAKPRGDGRFGFVDMIFGDVHYSIIELKYINILGLIKAINNNWNVSPCTNDLANFDEQHNIPKITTLNEILLSAEEQVTRYMNVIANGPVQNGKPGIIDSRAVIKRPSNYDGVLNCYVIMVIGFRRLVFRSVGSQNTPYSITKK